MSKVVSLFFSLILCFLCVPILVACSGGIPLHEISPAKVSYSVLQGEEVQLEVNFSPTEATNKVVTYSVLSGSEYISVDVNGVVKAKVVDDKKAHDAQVLVTADYDSNMKAVFKIKVLAEKIKLSAPTGLIYSGSEKSLSWNSAEYVDDTDPQMRYSPCYALAIAEGNTNDMSGARIIDVKDKTSYSFDDAGTYSVWVKAVSDNEQTFSDSDYSQKYVFTILDTPQDIKFMNSKIYAELLSDSSVSVTKDAYKLSVTKKSTGQELTPAELDLFVKKDATEIFDGKEYVVWTIPYDQNNSFGVGQFDVKVKLTISQENVFDSNFSEAKTFNRLLLPQNVAVVGDLVEWDLVSGAEAYEVVIGDDFDNPKQTPTNSYRLESEITSLDSYRIKVRAVGNGEEILNGFYVDVDTIKLGKVKNLTAEQVGVSTKISWQKVSFENYYEILLNNTHVTETSGLSYAFLENEMNFVEGENIISVVAKSNNLSYADSDPNSLSFVKLINPTPYSRNDVIAWNEIEHATGYELKITYNTQSGVKVDTFNLTSTTLSFSLAGEEYKEGEYKAAVKAVGDGVLIRTANEVPSEDAVTFIKQNIPEDLVLNGEGVLSWNKGSYISPSSYFVVTIHNTNDSDTTNDINLTVPSSLTSVDLSSYLTDVGFGKYVFSVQTKNNVSDSFYLNSDSSEKIGFYRLGAPTGLKIKDGGLAWDDITLTNSVISSQLLGKYRYILQIGNKTVIPSDEISNEYSLNDSDSTAGANRFCVKVKIKDNTAIETYNVITVEGQKIYLLSSNYSSYFNFSKLNAPEMPFIDGDFITGKIVEGADSYCVSLKNSSGAEITVDETNVDGDYWKISYSNLMSLDNKTGTFTISVKAYGKNNYVDSNYSRQPLTVFRMSAPKLEIDENFQLIWKDVTAKIDEETLVAQTYLIYYKESSSLNWHSPISVSSTSWDTTGLPSGTYAVKIKAVSQNARVLSSDFSTEKNVIKLSSINKSTIKVKAGAYPYNIITWDGIEVGETNPSYLVSVYNRLSTGEKELVRVETVDVAESGKPEMIFDNTYDLENYQINIQTVLENCLKSDLLDEDINIKRLKKPTNLNVSGDEYNLTWDFVSGVYDYKIDMKGLNETLTNDYSTTELNPQTIFGLYSTLNEGAYSITVQSIIDGTSLNLVNNTLTISSAESAAFKVVKLASPTLSISNGLIRWSDPNQEVSQYGYKLVFNLADTNGGAIGDDIEIYLDKNVDSYDMSSPLLSSTSGPFVFYITSLGNEGIYIESDRASISNCQVKKLDSPEFYVSNGIIKWDAVPNATSYTAVVYKNGSENNKYTQDDITDCQMPTAPLAGKTGDIRFTLQSIGTVVGFDGVAYINSATSMENKVFKWEAPTGGLKVVDGEIDWLRTTTTMYMGIQSFSSYNIVYNGIEQTIGQNESFKLSDYVSTKANVDVKVCIVGTPNFRHESGTAWINSDYSNVLTVNIVGQPTITIEDGAIKWKENAQDLNSYNDYELLINNSISIEITTTQTLLTLNTFGSLDEYSPENVAKIEALSENYDLISSIKIRHKGSASNLSAENIYVNSKYSNEIKNIQKLKQATNAFVNDDGNLQWRQNSENDNVIVSADDQIIDKVVGENYELVGKIGYLNFKDVSFLSENFSILLGYFTQGTLDLSSLKTGEHASKTDDQILSDLSITKMLSSEKTYLTCYRFAKADSMWISDDGLKLQWQYTEQISLVMSDKFIITYKFKGKDSALSFDNISEQTKIVSINEIELTDLEDSKKIASIPFWGVGTYQVSIQVSSTSQNVIPSEQTIPTSMVFNKFYGGCGTIDEPYVIKSVPEAGDTSGFYDASISATKQFYFIKQLPTLYYLLEEDIELYEGSELVSFSGQSQSALYSNFMFNLQEYDRIIFCGGIDGNGHAIKNYQVYVNAIYASLFRMVVGDVVSDASANLFYSRSGIIKDLTLEVDEFNYSSIFQDIGFFATQGYGTWLVDCNLEMSEKLSNAGGINIATTITGKVLYGGFVARLYSAFTPGAEEKISEFHVNRDAKLMNCVSNIDVTITRANNLQNYNVYIGGLVGAMYGAKILNCKNIGDLGASQVGGIVCEAQELNAYKYENSSWVIYGLNNSINGCLNSGKLTSYATMFDNGTYGTSSQSGGILGYAGTFTYITNSIQAGELEVVNGNYYADSTKTTKVVATIGGISGNAGDANVVIVNCVNLASRVNYNSSFVSANSKFYGIAANGAYVQSSYYHVNEQSNYARGVYGSEASLGLSEENMKSSATSQDAQNNLVNKLTVFGDISGDNISIYSTITYQMSQSTSGSFETTLVYDKTLKQINLICCDGINFPTLKTYTILNA